MNWHCYLNNQSKSWERVWAKKTENVCHWSLLMLLELAEQHTTSYMSYKQMKTLSSVTTRQPIQILKKVWPLFFCHWSLLMPLAPAGQSIQLLICHVSRWRLCHRSPEDNQSKSQEKMWPLVFLSLGMVSMTPGNSLLLVYIRLGISSKA